MFKTIDLRKLSKPNRQGSRDLMLVGLALSCLLLFAGLGDRLFRLAEIGADHGSLIISLLLLNVGITLYG